MSSMNMQRRLWISLGAFVSVALLIGGLLYSKPSAAAPGIAWQPSSITDTISPGQQQRIPISFTASANIANGMTQVVPALQGFVQVTPSLLGNITKSQTVSLTLIVSAPLSAPFGVTQGTVHVIVGASTIAQPLPVQIIVASGAVGPLPPDPGAAGMATLAGIDSDNDGVRDDIERYIWLTYPQSEKTRVALLQLAVSVQRGLIAASSGDTNEVLSRKSEASAVQDCLFYIGGTARDAWKEVYAEQFNTLDRSKAYVKWDELSEFQRYRTPPHLDYKTRCTFDPDALPN